MICGTSLIEKTGERMESKDNQVKQLQKRILHIN